MTKTSNLHASAFTLRTPVGFCGHVTRQEVGGPVCIGVIVGTYLIGG